MVLSSQPQPSVQVWVEPQHDKQENVPNCTQGKLSSPVSGQKITPETQLLGNPAFVLMQQNFHQTSAPSFECHKPINLRLRTAQPENPPWPHTATHRTNAPNAAFDWLMRNGSDNSYRKLLCCFSSQSV